MTYEANYERPYPNGYVNIPDESTPEMAEFINARDDAILKIEDFLAKLELSDFGEEIENLVPKTRTIAGIDLADDITKEELTSVLEFECSDTKWISQMEYDELSDDEKDSDNVYYIYDADTNGNAYSISFESNKYTSKNVGDSLNEIINRISFKNIPVTINSNFVDTVNANPSVLVRQSGPLVIVDLYDIVMKSIVNDGSTTIIASGLPKASTFFATHLVNKPPSGNVTSIRVGIGQNYDKIVCWWSTASNTPIGAFTGQLMYFTSEW